MTFGEQPRVNALERELKEIEAKLAALRDVGGDDTAAIRKLEHRRGELARLLAGQRPDDADIVTRTDREDPITGADLQN